MHNTVRLLFPQWQGGNNGYSYPLGARLLSWLAPESDAPLLEVPVQPYDGGTLAVEEGVVGRDAVIRQARAARHLLDAYAPDRVITFGGDCLVSQSPFDYLNGRYDGTLGVIWIDAHPDVTTPKDYVHSHAMVLGNLLGEGEPGLAREVRSVLDPQRVMLVGVDAMHDYETEVVMRLGLSKTVSSEVTTTSKPVISWIRSRSISRVAIHLDLDVLDLRAFRSQLLNNPDSDEDPFSPAGKLSFPQITRLITDIEKSAEVVGITYAEHMPWDDLNLQRMMDQLAIMH